ncbi:MAG: hypothetical protein O3B01_27535 [Planctomycetota bacterium]|nr:hypothetical protein [Planctomycetota bacterium]MDA1142334.1 hypothetical protein [Planctomycetota bacterium]
MRLSQILYLKWLAVMFVAVALLCRPTHAAETPSSFAEPATVDTPILRIPMMKTPPNIDGAMDENEWEDSAALSGFWYDFSGGAGFRFLAPVQTQLQVYAAYDKENLYLAYTSPVYPEDSWLKARGRFPDVYMHPLYGIIWDDHLELELRPYHDHVKGFRMGLYKWFTNPIATYSDQYWTVDEGEGRKWGSKAKIRSSLTGTRWIVEYAIPLKEMAQGHYQGNDDDGNPIVKLPPPDETAYRCWFTRAIGGNGPFFNATDNHSWNTTKTKLVFDSHAPSFQLTEMGPIMEDMIDLQLSVKNHNSRSETVRIGFFMESTDGPIYSSYESSDLKDGVLEMVPGESKKIRLRQPFPGISKDNNVLWFDIRSAGQPAKVLFRTRLMRFHSMNGGEVIDPFTGRKIPFQERRLDVIAKLRPPRLDFDFRWNFSSYTKRLSGVVDKGIHGASEEAKRAVEAKIRILKANEDEDVVKEMVSPFKGEFATFLFGAPELVQGEKYKVSLLLFDANKRIVGERNPDPFVYEVPIWQGNKIGLEDVVWEPFEPIKKLENGFETLKHRFTLAPSGLPAQVMIKPDVRELPLEKRAGSSPLTETELMELGRGAQLRLPMRLEASINGQRLAVEAVEPAKLVREWKSEFEYASKVKAGPVLADLNVRYDCDGSMHVNMNYEAENQAVVEGLELVTDVAGMVDMVVSAVQGGGMQGSDRWELELPKDEGVVWDSTMVDRMELFYSRFVPYFWFGSADRGFSWYSDSDQGWILDDNGSTMSLERNKNGEVTWRVKFINHKAAVKGRRSISFTVLTHPAKPKPKDFRKLAWHYQGTVGLGYQVEPIVLTEDYLKERWHFASGAPKELPWEKAATWRKEDPPWVRYGQWRNVGVCDELDQVWEDKATWYFEQHIRIGRRTGWWMDEYWPVGFGRSENLAMGNAYLRDPDSVKKDELPWQSAFLTTTMRRHYKRLSRVFETNNVPQRQCVWSNNEATFLESFVWDTHLVEGCGATNRSFDVDILTQFPISLYKYWAHQFTGLVTRFQTDAVHAWAGDDKRLDRQYMGIALTHDIGHEPNGPHGAIQHPEQAVRLLKALKDFGYFEDENTEVIPYWRNGKIIRYGQPPEPGDAFALSTKNPLGQVYVTVYRRPLENQRGYKALIVILNGSEQTMRDQLYLAQPERIFGGPNRLTTGEILKDYDLSFLPENSDWGRKGLQGAVDRLSDEFTFNPAALRDLEDNGFVRQMKSDGKIEVYGRIHIPRHDYRVFYGYGTK